LEKKGLPDGRRKSYKLTNPLKDQESDHMKPWGKKKGGREVGLTFMGQEKLIGRGSQEEGGIKARALVPADLMIMVGVDLNSTMLGKRCGHAETTPAELTGTLISKGKTAARRPVYVGRALQRAKTESRVGGYH